MSSSASSITCNKGVPSGASSARPSTVTFTILGACGTLGFAALVELASAAMETGPQMWLTFVLDAVLQFDQPVEHGLGTWRTSGDVDVDRDDAVDALEHCVVVVGTSRAGAGAEGHHPLRVSHLLPHAAQDGRLALGDGADHPQQVGLARSEARQRGAEAVEVVARAGDREVFHSAAGGDEWIGEKGVLARPLHGVIQAREREAFGKGPTLVVERVPRECAAHHEGRKSASPLSHIVKYRCLPIHLSRN